MRRIALLGLALAALLPLVACGTGAGGNAAGGAFEGPAELALPVFADGALKALVLRNLATQDAPVKVTTVPGGATATYNVPATGELRVAVGLAEGWLIVDTRDPGTQAVLSTTGFVEPYLWAERAGPDGEAAMAAVFQSTEAILPVHPATDRALLLNHGPAGSFTVCTFAADGTLLSVVPQVVAQDASAVLDLSGLAGTAGHLSVLPPGGGGAAYAVAALEDEDLVYESDDRVERVSRLLTGGGSSLATLVVDFGRDGSSGDTRDFDLLVANGTDAGGTFTLHAVYDGGGNAVLAAPRLLSLSPRASRLYATTLADSIGLGVGETHPYADLFGDVFTRSSVGRYHLIVSVSDGVFLTGRAFDPFAQEFGARLRPVGLHHSVSVLVSDAQTTTQSGIHSEVLIENPNNGPIQVAVRGFTETEGTEYVLPTLVVPARSVLAMSADALGLTEVVGDTISPPARNLRLRYSSNAVFGLFARQTRQSPQELLVLVTPYIVRPEN